MNLIETPQEDFERARDAGAKVSRRVMGVATLGFLYAGFFHFLLPGKRGCWKIRDHAYAPPAATASPDYIHNKDDWEITVPWQHRDDITLEVRAPAGDITPVGALKRLPDIYLAEVPTEFDDQGAPSDSESVFFHTEEEAVAAIELAYREHGIPLPRPVQPSMAQPAETQKG